MPSIFVIALSGLLSTYMFLRALMHFTQDANEPLAIDTSIPFISPIISMWRKGSKYWDGMQTGLF
ncbi:hypothetical protein VMCG_03180 [Cytospora schulzeri]|uniref:Uncharacterized protein n=1 Tax=Cytospora schulzeri TaxID=448051 RepID=A0A423WY95_9PEZI|nr:hypothetical protein VMCG_03180 [Valsa malicola]